jgi:hypothetical protein
VPTGIIFKLSHGAHSLPQRVAVVLKVFRQRLIRTIDASCFEAANSHNCAVNLRRITLLNPFRNNADSIVIYEDRPRVLGFRDASHWRYIFTLCFAPHFRDNIA